MQVARRNWRYDVVTGEGVVSVTPEDADDIWVLYNLIVAGDRVECATMRKVLQEDSGGEVVASQKIRVVLAGEA